MLAEKHFQKQNRGFKKYERLKSKKLLGLLFSKGESIRKFPVKVIYLPINKEPQHPFPIKVLISVSKRLHSKASVRNKYKRLLKEAYRLEKNILLEELLIKEQFVALGFIYRSKTPLSLIEIRTEIKNALQEVLEKLNTP